jgi:siroheme synthase
MVHFVGAGSGAVDLITVRGARLLGEADVVIYAGSLVNPELLNYTKQGCEIYNSATMTLEEVIDVIKATEAEGKVTVRLHTGDSSIYGAVREQFDELKSSIATTSVRVSGLLRCRLVPESRVHPAGVSNSHQHQRGRKDDGSDRRSILSLDHTRPQWCSF